MHSDCLRRVCVVGSRLRVQSCTAVIRSSLRNLVAQRIGRSDVERGQNSESEARTMRPRQRLRPILQGRGQGRGRPDVDNSE